MDVKFNIQSTHPLSSDLLLESPTEMERKYFSLVRNVKRIIVIFGQISLLPILRGKMLLLEFPFLKVRPGAP